MKIGFMKTVGPAPILNTPIWKNVFCDPLPLDKDKLLRPIETVLLTESLIRIVKICSDHIVQVNTNEYPGEELYMDDRFLVRAKDISERKRVCPPLKELLYRLKNWPKTAYIWGGNVTHGVELLAKYYPIPQKADPFVRAVWILKGVDCSGLLYEATDGFLPRNTSQLLQLGVAIPIANKTPEEIARLLIPGDLIVWKGHVMIVEEEGTVFESAVAFGGTARTNLVTRLTDITKQRQPDISFSVRRWHQDTRPLA